MYVLFMEVSLNSGVSVSTWSGVSFSFCIYSCQLLSHWTEWLELQLSPALRRPWLCTVSEREGGREREGEGGREGGRQGEREGGRERGEGGEGGDGEMSII